MSKRKRPRKSGLRYFGETDRCIHEELIRMGFEVRKWENRGQQRIARHYVRRKK
ncbi:MAG: hypothetical protein KAJ01_10425 [Candidatus Hydrogenedentes bacterium]|nr:hypothetical protein [Candidatus Hydrogenedentota bacterium]